MHTANFSRYIQLPNTGLNTLIHTHLHISDLIIGSIFHLFLQRFKIDQAAGLYGLAGPWKRLLSI